MHWLEILGLTKTNWKEKTVEFEVEGKKVRIEGDKSLGKFLFSLKAMARTLGKERNGVLIELNNMEFKVENIEPIPIFTRCY